MGKNLIHIEQSDLKRLNMNMREFEKELKLVCKEALKHMEMTLSLLCMIKDAVPSAMQGSTTRGRIRIYCHRRRRRVFLPNRKHRIHVQEAA